MRIFQPKNFLSIDLAARKLFAFSKGAGQTDATGMPAIDRDENSFPDGYELMDEIAAFVTCVRDDRAPLQSGEDGSRALETAFRVTTNVEETLELAGFGAQYWKAYGDELDLSDARWRYARPACDAVKRDVAPRWRNHGADRFVGRSSGITRNVHARECAAACVDRDVDPQVPHPLPRRRARRGPTPR